jgi:hypothetical protein
VEKTLDSDSCVQHLEHLFKAESGLFACNRQLVQSVHHRGLVHLSPLNGQRVGQICGSVCDAHHKFIGIGLQPVRNGWGFPDEILLPMFQFDD